MHRHDLVYLQAHESYEFMNASLPLSVRAAVEQMITAQQPLTVCRQDSDTVTKVAASYIEDGRKYRLALTLPKPPAVITSPLRLEALVPQLPKALQTRAQQFIARCADLESDVYVYGSFANQYFTGLPFITPTSDLDILIVAHRDNISPILLEVAAFGRFSEAALGLKIDGEIRLQGRDDISFNELSHAMIFDIPTVLVKTLVDIRLQTIDVLLGWNTDEYEHFIRSNRQTFSTATGSLATD
ncbi:malonate decarboxylase holo-[acyl-carrier-protein] synthase [Psychrobacter vallis]|uniref:malonate decarboxylase holo-[acyl-carrier-protein] synthase n=1 Tax=Psychrobacter vallis TaxID=248451 RepID=UPI00191AE455|nr:malonate decarboxylase holo-[acyl-carrier-protein] synthase [Psychrobacter vallis]